MNTLEQKALQYAELDAQEKSIKKQKTPLNKAIKEEMKSHGLKTFEVGNVKLSYDEQVRQSMNEERLVEKLKSLGLHEAIKTVERPDEAVIEQLIYEGKLSAHELESCVEKKVVEVLKVGVKK